MKNFRRPFLTQYACTATRASSFRMLSAMGYPANMLTFTSDSSWTHLSTWSGRWRRNMGGLSENFRRPYLTQYACTTTRASSFRVLFAMGYPANMLTSTSDPSWTHLSTGSSGHTYIRSFSNSCAIMALFVLLHCTI